MNAIERMNANERRAKVNKICKSVADNIVSRLGYDGLVRLMCELGASSALHYEDKDLGSEFDKAAEAVSIADDADFDEGE